MTKWNSSSSSSSVVQSISRGVWCDDMRHDQPQSHNAMTKSHCCFAVIITIQRRIKCNRVKCVRSVESVLELRRRVLHSNGDRKNVRCTNCNSSAQLACVARTGNIHFLFCFCQKHSHSHCVNKNEYCALPATSSRWQRVKWSGALCTRIHKRQQFV